MQKFALIYGSSEGHTATVAEHIAAIIRQHTDTDVDVFEGRLVRDDIDLGGYDGFIVGASIHAGKYQSYILDFATRHRETLCSRPSAFFSVSLTSATENIESQNTARSYVDTFVDQTGWEPDLIALFAGALAYTHYGFLKRSFMRYLTKKSGGKDVDTSRDYVYTNWDDVDAFASTFLQIAAHR
jgi:menaquinone-dependent protoporphyrinogen oxidase